MSSKLLKWFKKPKMFFFAKKLRFQQFYVHLTKAHNTNARMGSECNGS